MRRPAAHRPGTRQQRATTAPATATATQPAASPSPSPRAPATALTIGQAKAAYQRIVDPYNRATDAINTDFTDVVPLSQFRADIAVVIARLHTLGTALKGIRWPSRVQPYITAMTLTDIPDNIACYTALWRAPTYADAQVVNETNQSCQAASASASANQVRTLFGLPPRS